MIRYDDLHNALIDWRARQGLPPLHNIDFLGELRQDRIDTSSVIAQVTGSLEVSDLDVVGDAYDDPLADPPSAAGGDDPWAVDNSAYASAEDMDDPFASMDEYSDNPYEDAGGFTLDEEVPGESGGASYDYGAAGAADAYGADDGGADAYGADDGGADAYGAADGGADPYGVATDQPMSYDDDDLEAPTSYDVGDSTAMFQELAPAQPGQYSDDGGYQPGAYAADVDMNYDQQGYDDPAPLPPVAPGPGQATAMFDTSLAANAAAAVEGMPPAPPVGPPLGSSVGESTAIFDTNLATNAAAAAGYYDSAVPSEPVYDSMAAQAEYQAERLAEQQAHDGYGYDPDQPYGAQADGQSYAHDGYDPNAYQPGGEPPPLEPPPGDFAFPFPDDDDYGKS